MTRPRSRSLFRPHKAPDPGVLKEHHRLTADIGRRRLLRGTLSLGALGLLTGCNVSESAAVQRALRTVSSFNDGVQELLFDPERLAMTYPADRVVKPPRFNAHFDIEDLEPIDLATWQLEFAGLIADRKPWTLEAIRAFPAQDLIIKHVCVEGWDYIGQWSGPNLRSFLTAVGADLRAKYVAFHCNDDYMESIDMASALHPQTILATHYAGEPITEPFGAPLRLRTSVKLGYKNPKWIRAIEVTNVYPGGFWEDQGFNWFAGI